MPGQASAYIYRESLVHEGLRRFFDVQTFSDVCVAIEARTGSPHRIRCHQLVLSACSRRFADMLEEGRLTGEELPVRGVDPAGLAQVLRFFYTGECRLDPACVIPVYDAAHRLDVPGLAAACDAYIRRALGPDTACSLLQAALRFGMADYASSCSRVIRASFDAVVQSDDFLRLELEPLLRLLEDNVPHHSEGSVFRAAWRWGMSSPARMQDMPRLFKLVKVPNLSMRDLVTLAGPLPGPAPAAVAAEGCSAPGIDGAGGGPCVGGAAATRLRQAQETLISSMLSGMDLVRAVKLAVQQYDTADAEPVPPARPAPACLALGDCGGGRSAQQDSQHFSGRLRHMGGAAPAAPAAAWNPRPPPPGCQPQRTTHIDGAPFRPATDPAAPAAAWQEPCVHRHDSPCTNSPGPDTEVEMANSSVTSAGHLGREREAVTGCGHEGGHDVQRAQQGRLRRLSAGQGPHCPAAAAGAGPVGDASQGVAFCGIAPTRTAGSAGSGGSGTSLTAAGAAARCGAGPGLGLPDDEEPYLDRGQDPVDSLAAPHPEPQRMGTIGDASGRQAVPVINPLPPTHATRRPPSAHGTAQGVDAVSAAQRCVCQVDNCGKQLSACSEEQMRLRICDSHYWAAEVLHGGCLQRFCQQCGRLQPLEEFEAGQWVCRARCQPGARRRKRGRRDGEACAGATAQPAPAGLAAAGAAAAAPGAQNAARTACSKPQQRPASAGGGGSGSLAAECQRRPLPGDREARRPPEDSDITPSSSMCSGGGPAAEWSAALAAPAPSAAAAVAPAALLPHAPLQPLRDPAPRRQELHAAGTAGGTIQPTGAQWLAPAGGAAASLPPHGAPSHCLAAWPQQQEPRQQAPTPPTSGPAPGMGPGPHAAAMLAGGGDGTTAHEARPPLAPALAAQPQNAADHGSHACPQPQQQQPQGSASGVHMSRHPVSGSGHSAPTTKLILSTVPLRVSAVGAGAPPVPVLHLTGPPARELFPPGPGIQGGPPRSYSVPSDLSSTSCVPPSVAQPLQVQLQRHRSVGSGPGPRAGQPGAATGMVEGAGGEAVCPRQQQQQQQQQRGASATFPHSSTDCWYQKVTPSPGTVLGEQQQQQQQQQQHQQHVMQCQSKQGHAQGDLFIQNIRNVARAEPRAALAAPQQQQQQLAQGQQPGHLPPQDQRWPGGALPHQGWDPLERGQNGSATLHGTTVQQQGASAVLPYGPTAPHQVQAAQPPSPQQQQQQGQQQQQLSSQQCAHRLQFACPQAPPRPGPLPPPQPQGQCGAGAAAGQDHCFAVAGLVGAHGLAFGGVTGSAAPNPPMSVHAVSATGPCPAGAPPRHLPQQLQPQPPPPLQIMHLGQPCVPQIPGCVAGMLTPQRLGPAQAHTAAGASALATPMAQLVTPLSAACAGLSCHNSRPSGSGGGGHDCTPRGASGGLRVSVGCCCSFEELADLVTPVPPGLFDCGLTSPNTELFNLLGTANGGEDTIGPMLDLLVCTSSGESLFEDTANTDAVAAR